MRAQAKRSSAANSGGSAPGRILDATRAPSLGFGGSVAPSRRAHRLLLASLAICALTLAFGASSASAKVSKAASLCSPWQTAPESAPRSPMERRERLAMPGDPVPPGHGRAARRRSTNFVSSIAAPAAGHLTRAGLIEQSTRAQGNGFSARSMSKRPAGPIPAGITQGEEISC